MRPPPERRRGGPGEETASENISDHGGDTDDPIVAPAAVSRWHELLAAARAEAGAACRERRAAVLAHPDLAARLCQPPIGYARPDQWNGYIPPATWREQHNDSPRRAALEVLYLEALHRGGET